MVAHGSDARTGATAASPSPATRDLMVSQIIQLRDVPIQVRALAVGAWLERARQHGPSFYGECVQRAVELLSHHPQVLVSPPQ